MKKYEVVIANPAGNITAIVLDKEIPRADYSALAKALMNKAELAIEQVGYVKDPQRGGRLRLEMMGGEFCGNAARSFGLYLAAGTGDINEKSVTIEVSGCSTLLEVATDVQNQYARTMMPLPKGIDLLAVGDDAFPAVVFEGIVHVIIENCQFSQALYQGVKEAVTQAYAPEAFGLMFFNAQELKLIPLVYVRETATMIFEQSCGSGTVAAAVYLAKDKGAGRFSWDIANPGGSIEGTIYKRGGEVREAYIGGKIVLSEIKTMIL